MISSKQSTDVFIVGGGPAGLATAIAARQRGMTVVVADGSEPPIDKACGEGLGPDALGALRELGVALAAGVGVRYQGIRFVEGEREISGSFRQEPGLGVPRTVLHHRLIAEADQCGVQLMWRTPVAAIAPRGVYLGKQFITARWIVGADGNASRVRRWAGLEHTGRLRQRYAKRRHYRLAPWSEYV